MKNEKTKKIEKTKVTLVREVEEKFGLSRNFLSSLERANKETITRILAL